MNEAILSQAFSDPEAVRVIVNRLGMRAATKDARSAAEALRDLMRERVEMARGDGLAGLLERVSLTRGDLQSGIDVAALAQAERDALREDKLLESVELLFKLFDEIEVAIGQGLFSGLCCQEDSEAKTSGHRLSGGAK